MEKILFVERHTTKRRRRSNQKYLASFFLFKNLFRTKQLSALFSLISLISFIEREDDDEDDEDEDDEEEKKRPQRRRRRRRRRKSRRDDDDAKYRVSSPRAL